LKVAATDHFRDSVNLGRGRSARRAKIKVVSLKTLSEPEPTGKSLGLFKGTYYVKQIRATVVADIKARASDNQSLLMGVDETYNFVAALPDTARSVRDAHDLLRGDVTKGSPRQGEWFFEKIDKDLGSKLDEIATNTPWRVSQRGLGDLGTTHFAMQTLDTPEGLFATGYIIDSRRRHHKGLYLSDWHKVVRNREVVTRNANTRTWD
jgi:hypothetical protein